MASTKRIIAIVGVTGNQGTSTAETFLQEADWTVRGISRNVSSSTSKALAERGVEMVQGDLDDVESMKRALHGANVIFGNTNFMQHMEDPVVQARAKEQGRNINELATDYELVQAKGLIDAVASTLESLELFVFSAFSDTKGWSKGKITYNLHFDRKWEAVEYLQAQYQSLWEKTSLLQMGLFMSNIWFPLYTPRKQSDGTFRVRLAALGEAIFPMVDPNSDTGPLVRALTQLPPKTNLVGTSELCTWNKWCEIWSRVNGVTCTFEKSTAEEAERLIGPFGREMSASFQYIEEFGLTGGDPTAVYPWDLGIKMQLSTVEGYIRSQDWSQILGA